jgi:elongator complex protein 3
MKDLIELLLAEKKLTKLKAEDVKRRWAGSFKIEMPLSSEVLKVAKKMNLSKANYERLVQALVTKPTRTLSGVAIIAVAAKPAACPGKCVYCPRGADAPQSYTGHEPAIMRALSCDYDPCEQVKLRLKQLRAVGHSVDKCELIIMGGTFPAFSLKYKKWFVKRCYDGFNKQTSKSLKNAQRLNETSKNRVVGLTIETRPDWVFPERFLEYGCTRVELGIQSVYDSILKKVKRGHSVKTTVDAVAQLKEHGFKILYQVMLGLPGSSLRKDIQMFKKLFGDKRFKPDMLKIYPTLVVRGSELYDLWKAGKYKPIDEAYVMAVLEAVYKMAPKWVRIHRVQRDIPSDYIEAGPVRSNLRQELVQKWDKLKKRSNEIRFREVGQVYRRLGKRPENEQISVQKYKASGGEEYFISVEDKKQNILLGFCRLRITVCTKAFVRELHVYGETLPLGSKKGAIQHAGRGKKLLARAEELARKHRCESINVISGVGVREYYRRLGYGLKNGYMVRKLK